MNTINWRDSSWKHLSLVGQVACEHEASVKVVVWGVEGVGRCNAGAPIGDVGRWGAVVVTVPRQCLCWFRDMSTSQDPK